MNIVVAGASGFIGRRAVIALRAAGHTVVELGRDDIAAIARGGRAEVLAVTTPADVRATTPADAVAVTPADVLVWAAGKREPDLAANRAIHVELPLVVARSLDARRFVYLSTGEVYGDAPLPYREDGPTLSTSDYARAKLEGERALDEASTQSSGGKTAIELRLGLVYGPDQSPRMLIPRLVTALRARERFPLTHGDQTRDLVFVDDVAAAIVRAAESATTGTFNIGSGVETRIRDLCEGIARAVGADPALLGFGEVALRPDEAHRYVMDVSRAANELGWRATTSLAEGLARL